MDNEEERGKPAPWWSTAPKFLTGIASLLTATTGLILAAYQMGYLKNPELHAAPSVTASPDPGRNDLLQAGTPFFMVRPVKESDLASMSARDLDLLRNEIYARHGRRFQRKDLQDYFDRQRWYKPLYAAEEFPAHLLNEVQQQNVEFIAAYQQRMQRR
jgi:hypothetical protein